MIRPQLEPPRGDGVIHPQSEPARESRCDSPSIRAATYETAWFALNQSCRKRDAVILSQESHRESRLCFSPSTGDPPRERVGVLPPRWEPPTENRSDSSSIACTERERAGVFDRRRDQPPKAWWIVKKSEEERRDECNWRKELLVGREKGESKRSLSYTCPTRSESSSP